MLGIADALAQEYTFYFRLRKNPSVCSNPNITGDLIFDGKVFKYEDFNTDDGMILEYSTNSFPTSLEYSLLVRENGCGQNCEIQRVGSFNTEACFYRENAHYCEFTGNPTNPEFFIEAHWTPSDYNIEISPSPEDNQYLCISDLVRLTATSSQPYYTWYYIVDGFSTQVLNDNRADPAIEIAVKDILEPKDIGKNIYFRLNTWLCSSYQEIPFILLSERLTPIDLLVNQPSCNSMDDASIKFSLYDRELVPDETVTATISQNASVLQQSRSDEGIFSFENLPSGIYELVVESNFTCDQYRTEVKINDPDRLEVTELIVPLDCQGKNGSIQLNVSGGDGSYTFDWEGPEGFSSTNSKLNDIEVPGNYSVTVQDGNGCIVEKVISVEDNSFNISLLQGDLECNNQNGFIELNLDGGRDGKTIFWSGPQDYTSDNFSIYDLNRAGQYDYQIRDGFGCTVTGTVHIAKTGFDLTVSKKDVTCFGFVNGSVNISTTNGSGDFSYYLNGIESSLDTFNGLPASTYNIEVIDNILGCSRSELLEISQPEEIKIFTAISDYSGFGVSCYNAVDGSVEVVTSGGVAPYNISWLDFAFEGFVIENIPPGEYEFAVQDKNGCLTSGIASITSPPELELSVSGISDFNGYNVSCSNASDGSAELVISGGVTDYSIAWFTENEQSGTLGINLPAGSIPIRVIDANGCRKDSAIYLSAPQELVTEIIPSQHISCANESDGILTTSVTGGVPDYSYSWSNGITTSTASDLSSGYFNVQVIDANGCISQDSINLDNPNRPNINATVSDYGGFEVSCAGHNDGFIQLHSTEELRYRWSTGETTQNISGLESGLYTVEVTSVDSECSYTYDYELKAPDVIDLEVISSDNNGYGVSCFNSSDGHISVSPYGGTGSFTYQWSDGSTSEFRSDLDGGSYTLEVRDENLCSIDTVITISVPDPIKLDLSLSNYNGYNISCSGMFDGSIQALPAGGVGDYDIIWSDKSTGPILKNLKAGRYFVTVEDLNGCETREEILLTEPEEISLKTVASDASCFGYNNDTIQVIAEGGVGPHKYLLNNSNPSNTGYFNEVTPGEYLVTVIDANGCFVTDSVSIEPAPKVEVTILNKENTVCNESTGSIEVEIHSQRNYTSTWFDQNNTIIAKGEKINDLESGLYKLVIEDDQNCMFEEIYNIASRGIVEPDSIVVVAPSCSDSDDGRIEIYGDELAYSKIQINGLEGSLLREKLFAGSYFIEIVDTLGCTTFRTVEIPAPKELEIDTLIIASPTCYDSYDGSILVNMEGGTGTYNYHWSELSHYENQLSGLPGGIYSLEVEDENNCAEQFNIVLPSPEALRFEVDSIKHNLCYGDSAGYLRVDSYGGTGEKRIYWKEHWNNQSSIEMAGLSADQYPILVEDERGCQFQSDVTITQPDRLMFSDLIVQNSSCVEACDGSISFLTTGGFGVHSYFLNGKKMDSNIYSDLCNGLHFLQIQDENLCYLDSTIQIASQSAPELHVPSHIEVCKGQTSTFEITASYGETSWYYESDSITYNSMISFDSSGTYYINVDYGPECLVKDSIIFKRSSTLLSSHLLAPSRINVGDTAVMIDVSWPVPDSVQWELPESAQILSQSNYSIEVVFNEVGNFDIGMHVYLADCYDVDYQNIFVEEVLSELSLFSGDLEAVTHPWVYPNPLDLGPLILQLGDFTPIGNLKVFVIQEDRIVKMKRYLHHEFMSGQIEMDLDHLSPGLYHLYLEGPDKTEVLKFLKL